MRKWWSRLWRRASQTGLLMVGVPDYDAYLRHMQTHHPESPVLSRGEWVARAQEARYGGRRTGKCPC